MSIDLSTCGSRECAPGVHAPPPWSNPGSVTGPQGHQSRTTITENVWRPPDTNAFAI